MAFTFKTIGQEIAVWHLLNRTYESNTNTVFFEAVVRGVKPVELNNGEVKLVKHHSDEHYGESYVVFDYNGNTYRMDVSEYSSWDEESTVSEPYPVVAVPVNEVQYVRVKK